MGKVSAGCLLVALAATALSLGVVKLLDLAASWAAGGR